MLPSIAWQGPTPLLCPHANDQFGLEGRIGSEFWEKRRS
jgi:hypothetical protein